MTTPGELDRLAASLEEANEHALDTESNSGFAYRERLCLLQVAVAESIWLVDLAALPGGEKSIDALRPALESSERRTLLHGGEFDVACLRRDFDLQLGGVWDSQQAASLLGWEKTGYGALVERLCGVSLHKGHAFFDWCRRPLPERALDYAVDDVRYLPEVVERLRPEVERAELEEELDIANRAVMESVWSGGFKVEGFWSIRGAGSLDRAALKRLAVLYLWRDEVARRSDRPPGRVINNRALLALSRERNPGGREVRNAGIRGEVGEALRRDARRLWGEAARMAAPDRPSSERRRPDTEERRRSQELRRWRRQEAEHRGVSEQAVLPTRSLQHLARFGAENLQSVPQLGRSRADRYGRAIARICSSAPAGG